MGYAAGAGYSAGSTGEQMGYSADSGGCGGIHWRAITLAGYSAGSTDELLWDAQRDAW